MCVSQYLGVCGPVDGTLLVCVETKFFKFLINLDQAKSPIVMQTHTMTLLHFHSLEEMTSKCAGCVCPRFAIS